MFVCFFIFTSFYRYVKLWSINLSRSICIYRPIYLFVYLSVSQSIYLFFALHFFHSSYLLLSSQGLSACPLLHLSPHLPLPSSASPLLSPPLSVSSPLHVFFIRFHFLLARITSFPFPCLAFLTVFTGVFCFFFLSLPSPTSLLLLLLFFKLLFSLKLLLLRLFINRYFNCYNYLYVVTNTTLSLILLMLFLLLL